MRRAGADASATASAVSATSSSTRTPPTKVLRDNGTLDFRYPSERRAARQLRLAFPDADAELVAELAYLVSARRHTIDDAADVLQRLEEAGKNGGEGDGRPPRAEPHSHVPVNGRGASRGASAQKTATTGPATTTRAGASLQHAGGPAQQPGARSVGRSTGASAGGAVRSPRDDAPFPAPSVSSAAATRSAAVKGPAAAAVLFMTTMTGDRRIRDHCRQLETLLYLKRIRYVSVNVADDPFTQRRLREMYAASTGRNVMPPTPAFFVGEHFIGDYEMLQEMEDDGKLMETLYQHGYPRPQE